MVKQKVKGDLINVYKYSKGRGVQIRWTALFSVVLRSQCNRRKREHRRFLMDLRKPAKEAGVAQNDGRGQNQAS